MTTPKLNFTLKNKRVLVHGVEFEAVKIRRGRWTFRPVGGSRVIRNFYMPSALGALREITYYGEQAKDRADFLRAYASFILTPEPLPEGHKTHLRVLWWVRKELEEVTAVFVDRIGTQDIAESVSLYTQRNKHLSGMPEIMAKYHRPATEAEIAPLRREILALPGYQNITLIDVPTIPRDARANRAAALARQALRAEVRKLIEG